MKRVYKTNQEALQGKETIEQLKQGYTCIVLDNVLVYWLDCTVINLNLL